jgi:hypothetical protein
MAAKTIFQPGIQVRCSAQAEHVHHFILASNLGKIVAGRAQWHKQTSWRFSHGNPEREAALTLDDPFAAVDAGIVGKVNWTVLGTERVNHDDGDQPPLARR